MAITDDLIARGREACDGRAWGDAYEQLSSADGLDPLGAADLDRLAVAAYLTGHLEVAADAWERAHHAHLEQGEIPLAVRCAFWLGLTLVLRGEEARGGGWLARAQSVLEAASLDCVEHGYVRLPAALKAMGSGDAASAYDTFGEIVKIADGFGDASLMALGRLGRGQALIAMGEASRGVVLLDEAMVAVTTADVSPVAAGIVYCAVIIECRDIFDLRRAQEWTAALSRWCATQQDLKPYRGQCLVHRSEIMQLRGEWSDAMEEVVQARVHLADPPGDPVMGMAKYQQGELLRLRGQFARAEAAYREATGWGHPVQPGLALLRLAQGRLDDAGVAIRRAVNEADGLVQRSRVLSAQVEIALAAGDPATARTATDELNEIASAFDSPYLRAVVEYAYGSVLLAEGEAEAASVALRRAWVAWQQLDARYEAARVRVRMAEACHQLADHDAAEMELDAAGQVFQELGAAPALEQVRGLAASTTHRVGGVLTPRELEVLRLVATGATNRDIADTLVISEKTVARHMSNIFTKLGLTSRTGATAYAYKHNLV